METSIYGLKGEFRYQNEQSIMFYEKDGEELTTDDFNSVQLKMIQSNRIPHLLPLSVENMDLSAKLFYNIQSKSKIISFFRNNRTTMNDYYQLFLSIVKTLEDSSSYMLNQEHYILHTDYIFVGRNASDVYLIYLPIGNLERETTPLEDMKQLLTDIAGEVEGLQGNEFKSILSYIRSHNFSLPGLKKLLVDLMSLRSSVNQPQNDAAQAPGGDMQQSQDMPPSQGKGISAGSDRGMTPKNNHKQKVIPGSEAPSVKEKKVLPKLTSREMVYLIAAVILGVAITWKVYEMLPTPIMLIVCTVLSLAMLGAGFVYWKVWRPGVEPETKTVAVKTSNKKPANTAGSNGVGQKQQATQNQASNVPGAGNMNQQQPMGQMANMNQEPQTNQGMVPDMNPQQVPSQQSGMFEQPQANQGPGLGMGNQQSVPNVQPQQQANHPQGQHDFTQPATRPSSGFSQQMDQGAQQGVQAQQPQMGDAMDHFGQMTSGNAYAAATDAPFDTANADDTVLLDEEDDMPDGPNEQFQMPYIIRTAEDGETTTIQVEHANFLIGRNADSVSFVDDTKGVSRLHAEIIRIDATSYGIKDLGSKNGTKLNGESMVPYKVNALNEEDVFALGKASYTFTWSAGQ